HVHVQVRNFRPVRDQVRLAAAVGEPRPDGAHPLKPVRAGRYRGAERVVVHLAAVFDAERAPIERDRVAVDNQAASLDARAWHDGPPSWVVSSRSRGWRTGSPVWRGPAQSSGRPTATTRSALPRG